MKLGMTAHPCDPRTQVTKTGVSLKFEAYLG